MNLAPPHPPRQTPTEEWINAISHGLAGLLAIPGTVLLILRAVRFGSPRDVTGVSVFGATLLLLYLTSTLYHAIPPSRTKTWFRKLDHIAIYLLIAGTYTPFTLGPLRGGWGWSLFGVIWGLAGVGILAKLFLGPRFPIVSGTVYIGMGWMVLVALRPLVLNLSPLSLRLLVAGGAAYTGGVLFYACRRIPFHHGLWHLCVVLGSALHALAVYHLYPAPA